MNCSTIYFVLQHKKSERCGYMAVQLQRLIQKVSHMDVTIIAGKDGMNRLVSWVHMVETMEASDFLQGGEIAFTTGLGLSNSVSMLTLTQYIYNKGAAGIIVNTGPFIENIPQDVIDFCDEHSFPLFVVPWKIHLAEVMRIFCFTITKDDQRILQTSAAFKNAIFFPKQEELYVVTLSQNGFQVNWNYAVCVIQMENNHPDFLRRLEVLSESIDAYTYHHYPNCAVFLHEQEILVIAANKSEDELREIINDTRSHIRHSLIKNEHFTMGCGRLTKSIRCLYKSYHQAKSIQKLQQKAKIDQDLIFYSDMGIYKLLMGIEDKEIMTEYYERTVEPLILYDEKNQSDLATVLRTYLKHNGSVKETADELYVHRNTINYKLSRVESLLDIDLSSLDSRLQLSIGFMLLDML